MWVYYQQISNCCRPVTDWQTYAISDWLTEQWGVGVVICLERGADLHMVQPMPLPLTVSCCTKIQIGFTFLVLAHPGSPGQRAIKRVCVCVCVTDWLLVMYGILLQHLFLCYCSCVQPIMGFFIWIVWTYFVSELDTKYFIRQIF